jgi:hypothetical protein
MRLGIPRVQPYHAQPLACAFRLTGCLILDIERQGTALTRTPRFAIVQCLGAPLPKRKSARSCARQGYRYGLHIQTGRRSTPLGRQALLGEKCLYPQ